MKIKYFIVVSFMMLYYCNMRAQQNDMIKTNSISATKNNYIIVGIAGGVKYYTKKNNYEETLREFETSPTISLNVGINPFNKIEHAIGIEFLAYKYSKSKDKSIENVFGLNIYYKRSFYSSNNLFFFPQVTLCVVSNDPALILSTSVDLGIGYTNNEFDISLKNSFRLNIFTLQRVPSILLLGLSIKI